MVPLNADSIYWANIYFAEKVLKFIKQYKIININSIGMVLHLPRSKNTASLHFIYLLRALFSNVVTVRLYLLCSMLGLSWWKRINNINNSCWHMKGTWSGLFFWNLTVRAFVWLSGIFFSIFHVQSKNSYNLKLIIWKAIIF